CHSVLAFDLVTMEKKLPLPRRLVVPDVSVGVSRDMGVHEKSFELFPRLADDVDESISKIRRNGPEALDLGSRQDEARLDDFVDEVIRTRVRVRGDEFLAGLGSLRHLR